MTQCLYLFIYLFGGGVVYKPSFILFSCMNVFSNYIVNSNFEVLQFGFVDFSWFMFALI